jgi:DNA/RNA endonuclease YhcR with UshA esterase domain
MWGSERPKCGEPEKTMQGTHVCVIGKIELYRGRPEVIFRDPEQLT